MADNVNPDQKQPGENHEGKFHYNPGNQAGKTVEVSKPADIGAIGRTSISLTGSC